MEKDEIEAFWRLTEVFYQELAGSQFNPIAALGYLVSLVEVLCGI